MKVYYYDDQPGDQRLPHNSGETLTPSDLLDLGVLSYHFPNVEDPTAINDLAASRSYKNRDVITVSPDAMGDIYEQKVKGFFHEHLHEDEEIRYILDGAGYFDCRAKDEKWVRILLEKGDLIVMPAGIYHRFTTDENNYIKAMRLFKDEPKWTPLNRAPELDENQHRKEYMKSLISGSA